MEWNVLAASAAAILVLMLTMWVLSLRLRDASIVDIVWGFGFVVVAWVARLAAHGSTVRQNVLVVLTTVWGLRLASYLLRRNHGKGEDRRYRSMRKHYGRRWSIVSLYLVFGMQGALMFIVSLPVQLGQMAVRPATLGPAAWIGVAFWLVGFAFESIGDLQLARFKADPGHKGLVMDRGLWRYTRHPNYFGDFCVWWGLFLVAAETRIGLLAVVGPIAMTALLLRVSGVAMLERTIGRRRPGYAEYTTRTSAFFPRPPRAAQRS
jgi:steroid 5-alpha reductase family enzyme